MPSVPGLLECCLHQEAGAGEGQVSVPCSGESRPCHLLPTHPVLQLLLVGPQGVHKGIRL